MRLTNANAQTNTLWSDLPRLLLGTALLLSLSSLPTTWALSDKRLCADEKCERIISMGTAKISYAAGEEGMLPFKIHSQIRILSKGAGSNPKLWGVEINGRRGYANKDFILEKKVFIKESDLTYELPVQSLKPEAEVTEKPADAAAAAAVPAAAPAAAAIVNKPAAQLEPEQLQQSVLNASETADADVIAAATATTTSPLDTLKLSILTEHGEQASSGEATTPITPVQPNLQLVDGTQLPLEAVPATTERDLNLTKDETKPQAHNIEQPVPTTKSDEKFEEYEEDDEGYDDDDDDEHDDDEDEATLDSKDNEYRKASDKAEQPLEIKATSAQVAAENASVPIAAGVQLEQSAQLLDSTNATGQAEQKDTLEVQKNETLAEAITESVAVPTAAEAPNALPILVEELKVEAVVAAAEAKNEEQTNPAAEAAKEQAKALEDKAAELEAQKVKDEAEAALREAEAQKAKEESLKLEEALRQAEAQKVKEEEEALRQAEAQKAKEEEEALRQAETHKAKEEEALREAEAQKAKEESLKLEIALREAEAQKDKEQSLKLEAEVALRQAEAQKANEAALKEAEAEKLQVEAQRAEAEKLKQVEAELEAQVNNATAEAQSTTEQSDKAQAYEPIEALSVQTQAEAQEIQAEPKAPTTEAQAAAAEQLKLQTEAEIATEKFKAELEAQAAQQSEAPAEASTEAPEDHAAQEAKATEAQPVAEATATPSSLPPLFKQKSNFNDPNEIYKQLEQQRQQEQSKRAARDQEATTPSSPTFEVYDAAHEEATPAPLPLATGTVEIIGSATPASTPETQLKEDAGLAGGLFGTIMSTVNSFISKEPEAAPLAANDELHRLLYPDRAVPEVAAPAAAAAAPLEGHCLRPMDAAACHASINLDNFPEIFAAKVLDHSLLLLCIVIAAASSLFFMLVYYCFCNSSQEGALLSKLNHLERSLLAAHKENLIIKHDLMTTRTKLSSIEDNSFGSNDMVAALKKELETELYEKAKLQEQVSSLEKDLDNAAEAGLELNKMLSEVLNSQNGDEAFMSTVEELQRQLNDQDKVISEINANLAEKSRENSELQYSYTESTTRLNGEMKSLQQDNYELEMEKAKLQTRIEEMQVETEQELAKALEARNYEMQRLQHQIMELSAKYDKEHSELQTSLAKIEALEECLRQLKQDGNMNIQELIASAKTRGELNAAQKKYNALQAKLEQELAAKARLESQLQVSSGDVEQLKQDFNQSESDKLEAQTRLEVLSGYFRDKETQLQKELSLQEAKWLQHQGENASTVETQTLMKNEIQTLKSQNDELRAEIEAQIASHKAQMGTLENRAHESWLAARQSERRCEEAQAEAAALRRKLTAMATGGGGDISLEALPNNIAAGSSGSNNNNNNNGSLLGAELNSNPSPLPLPLPGSPGLLNMPNPLPFLTAPFPPFMGLPPPFLPPPPDAVGGGRLPPLGRMRSPPPSTNSRGGDRYDRDDYSDYDDYDEEEEEDERERELDRRHRRHSGSWGRGGRRDDDYVHSPRTYRSLSPSDSRYNYNNDTETDFSPPPSPPPARKHSSRPLSEV
ncbi:hypothetical protein KR222_010300 [Zaprionus bogoriensis]|nr:hypothetical protein KR222_010300 [Zaprionus bogoriensis]